MDGRTQRTKRMVSVAAGSVWEGRMRVDQTKGGIKVFNGQEMSGEDHQVQPGLRARNNAGAPAVGEKRKNNSDKNKDAVAPETSESQPDSLQVDKTCKVDSSCNCDGSSVKGRGQPHQGSTCSGRSKNPGCSDATGSRNRPGLKKIRSELLKAAPAETNGAETEALSQLRKVKSDPNRVVSVPDPSVPEASSSTTKPAARAPRSGEIKEKMMKFNPLGIITLCQPDHKEIQGHREEALILMNKIDSRTTPDPDSYNHRVSQSDAENTQEAEEAAATCEAGVSKKPGVCQDKLTVITSDREDGDEDGDEKGSTDDDKLDNAPGIEAENIIRGETSHPLMEINNAKETKTMKVIPAHKSKAQVIKKSSRVPTNSVSRKPPPCLNKQTPNYLSPNPVECPGKVSVSDDFYGNPEAHSRIQSLVDLVMWRDVSRSAFVFGIGAFMIISSSYAKSLNISFISVASYLGLVHLAVVFLYRSVICRGTIEEGNSPWINALGEEDVFWLVKLLLPYLNEFLLKIRSLLSGDPAVTMKLALVLFLLARCGRFITVWKMVKLGFFGVFIIPKLYSSYSTQMTEYGKFWIRRFQDAWRSCSHKKVVALAVFTLIWNFSSVVARAWAAFILFVAFRYYQQSFATDDSAEGQTGLHDVQLRRTRRNMRNITAAAYPKKEKKSS